LFAIASFSAFNFLFFLGVRPTLGYFPVVVQQGISWLAIVTSSFWLAKTWRRSAQRYHRERDANLLRRQLSKLTIDFYQALEGRSLEDLNPDELYALAKVLPDFSQDYRSQLYRGVVRDALEQRTITPAGSLGIFHLLRQNLGLTESDHWAVLEALKLEEPLLFQPFQRRSLPAHEPTIGRSTPALGNEETIYKSVNQSVNQSVNPAVNDDPDSTDDTTVYRTTDDATVYRSSHD
jgi:hypothetical protein